MIDGWDISWNCHQVNDVSPSLNKLTYWGDVIWRPRSGSTLAQVMACCLTAPSHYLNQCWLIFSKVQWHVSEGSVQPFTKIRLKIAYMIFLFKSPRGQWVNWLHQPCTYVGYMDRYFSCGRFPTVCIIPLLGNNRKCKYIENNVCIRVANCLCAHERVILVFISRVAQQRGK